MKAVGTTPATATLQHTLMAAESSEAAASAAVAAEDMPEPPIDTNDVHELAAMATRFEADVEKFLDDALIADVKSTALTTLDGVLEGRRERDERSERIQNRTKELLDEELAKQKHERELKDLEEAIAVTQQPVPGSAVGGKRERRASAGPGATAAPATEAATSVLAVENDATVPPAPFKLESETRKTNAQNPYVLNMTDFLSENVATRQARDLRTENELLRKCMSGDKRAPKAFETYLKRSAHSSI